MKISVFVGVSVDGFIARSNGDFDYLLPFTEPHGFEQFLASVDAVVMGRHTFETVIPMEPWPYGNKRIVVLSTRPLDLTRRRDISIEQLSGEPAAIVSHLASTGARHLYVDGGITIQRFLRAGLVDRLTVTRVPLLIGEGIPLFGPVPADLHLRHIATREYNSGLVSSDYEVLTRFS